MLHPGNQRVRLGTASAAVYLVARRPEDLETSLLEAANMLSSDTNTIAAMTGGLLGASLGLEAVPEYWRDQVADTLFLERLGLHLHRISRNENSDFKVRPVVTATLDTPLNRRTIQPAQRVVHAYLGPGEVLTVDIRPRLSGQHAVTTARIKFDTGQTCQFVFYSDKPRSSLFACSDTPVLPLTATCQQKQVKVYNLC